MNDTQLYIINCIQQYYNKYNKLPVSGKNQPDLGFDPSNARRLFGSWNHAILAAGFTPRIKPTSISTNCFTCRDPIIVQHKLYHARPNHYCSLSCAAVMNNKLHKKRQKTNTVHDCPKRQSMKIKADGPFTFIRLVLCKTCNTTKYVPKSKSGWYSLICSDACFIENKRRNATRTKRVIYNNQKFDSSWEVIVAKYLDANNIAWTIPAPIIWYDSSNKSHKYYADFYLPQINLYLDPKNPYVIRITQNKLDILSSQIPLIYGHPNDIINHINLLFSQERQFGVEPNI